MDGCKSSHQSPPDLSREGKIPPVRTEQQCSRKECMRVKVNEIIRDEECFGHSCMHAHTLAGNTILKQRPEATQGPLHNQPVHLTTPYTQKCSTLLTINSKVHKGSMHTITPPPSCLHAARRVICCTARFRAGNMHCMGHMSNCQRPYASARWRSMPMCTALSGDRSVHAAGHVVEWGTLLVHTFTRTWPVVCVPVGCWQ
jgi:hypothetical protein